MGLSYGFDGGFTIIFKIPLFPYFRSRYEDFETRDIKSGWLVKCLMWYARRRKRGDWVIDKPEFGSARIGKHYIITCRKDRVAL
jgi:hypothetical protein